MNAPSNGIRVLVVEDSPTVRQLLVHILNADPALQVIGTAADGEQAIEMVKLYRPHVITMDLHMPRMNGIDAVRIIMETMPTPIVIVSGDLAPAAMEETFLALTAGALAVIEKPAGIGGVKAAHLASNLVRTVKLMSEIKVVRRWPKPVQPPLASLPNGAVPLTHAAPASLSPTTSTNGQIINAPVDIQLVVIGASTGGPLVLHSILAELAGRLPVPIAIVQHIASGFTESFADWLGKSSGMPVHVAVAGERLLPGHAYIAPDGMHMGIKAGPRIALQQTPPENGHRPSVAHLFRATATVLGAQAVGVLLSGMGKDGAAELKLMVERGAVTIAQDPSTSVVSGMPGEAIKLGAAIYVLTPEKIASALLKLIAPAFPEVALPPPN